MLEPSLALLAMTAVYMPVVQAQAQWEANQINTTMCTWKQPRAAVLRDTLYMDGGEIWWLPGLADGTYDVPTYDGNPLGLVYTLNFSTPFNTTRDQNLTAIFGNFSKAPNGGAANNLAPNYYDGALLYNDNEYFMYGGLLMRNDQSPPPGGVVQAYQKFQYGPNKAAFYPGFVNDNLPNGLTRYLAYGGAASAPSENKAWYFGGLQSPSAGPIYEVSDNDTATAYNLSNTLITLDMSTQNSEVWSNSSLPPDISSRANPELVWVPVGAQGILVALGGVVYPDFIEVNAKSANESGSKTISPYFMININVYDIANKAWYTQPTSGGPGQLTRGCAVVAPAQDLSSFNIYYYGGYNGLDETKGFSDDVWILSLPSFMWMKVASGNAVHGRAGHKCVMPYPDQMIVVGGYTNSSGTSPVCLDGNVVQAFNLSSGTWMNRYDPGKWSEYGVPSMINVMIGGDASGGATMLEPSATGFASSEIAAIFKTAYPTSKIATYYPYGTASTNPDYSRGRAGVPPYLGPVLGVVLGLLFVGSLVFGWCLYRRRKMQRKNGGMSEAGTEDANGARIATWLRQQQADGKAPTTTTTTTEETTPMSPDVEQAPVAHAPIVPFEMADTQVHSFELMDTSPRVELSDTGLTPVQIIEKHSHFAPGGDTSMLSNPSYYSGAIQADNYSLVSQSTGVLPMVPGKPQHPHPQAHAQSTVRPDSPPLGTSTTPPPAPPHSPSPEPAADGHVLSGVSGISEHERSHLHQVGGDTSDGAQHQGQGPESMASASSPGPRSAAAGGADGPDHVSPRRLQGSKTSTSSPLRRSVFRESMEDMGGRAEDHDEMPGMAR